MPKRYYKHNKKDIQHQIDQLLAVYDFLGSQNRKKEFPTDVKQTSPKKGELEDEKIQR